MLLLCIFSSCSDDSQKREIENKKDLKRKEIVFANINETWNFNTTPINSTSQSMVASWPAWRDLLRELSQKPQSSIGAFQKKARTLTLRVSALPTQIPPRFDKPEVQSRILTLTTKINELNLFINLDDIPDKKVTEIIEDINTELTSLQMQMDEIVKKSMIPTEEGESEMIKMLDTSRAVPTKKATIPQPLEQGKIIQQIR
jgi:hypothetical protein